MKKILVLLFLLIAGSVFADDFGWTWRIVNIVATASGLSCTDCVGSTQIDETQAYALDNASNTFAGSFSGPITASLNAVTGTDSLTAADCGRITTVTAGIDTHTITLPEASTVIGCTFHIVYIGASGGALVDISPLDSDADGIIGSCTLAASVVSFSGTADADIGLTKATGLIGDWINLTAVSASQYAVTGCQGIWANN